MCVVIKINGMIATNCIDLSFRATVIEAMIATTKYVAKIPRKNQRKRICIKEKNSDTTKASTNTRGAKLRHEKIGFFVIRLM